jgi:hypothetical protein
LRNVRLARLTALWIASSMLVCDEPLISMIR